MQEEQQQKSFKKTKKAEQLHKLFKECPACVLSTLSYIDTIKPLLWANLSINGGKLSYRGAAIKYGITLSKVETIIKNIKKIQNPK